MTELELAVWVSGRQVDLTTIQVRQSDLAVHRVGPKVVHKKRWFHTVVYHERKQRQLIEQYGMRVEPWIYLVDPTKTAIPHLEPSVRLHFNQVPYILIHPQLWPALSKIIDRVKAQP